MKRTHFVNDNWFENWPTKFKGVQRSEMNEEKQRDAWRALGMLKEGQARHDKTN